MSEQRTPHNLILLTLASSAQVVIQFLIQVVVAYQFGARKDADSLAAALAVPTLLAAVISGSLGYVLVPELVACFTDPRRRSTGWRLAGLTGLISGCVAFLTTLAVVQFAPAIVGWLYRELDDDQHRLAIQLLRILAWQIWMSTLIGWSLSIHHSRHRFIVPALGGVVGTLATLALAYARGHEGITWIAVAINLGAAISAMIHVVPLLGSLRLGAVPRSMLVRLFWAIAPLVIGSMYLRIDPVVDRSLASTLSVGSVAHLHYAQRIILALLAISTSGLSVIAFPQLANRLAAEGRDGFVEHFALAARRLVLLTVPIAIGVSCFAVWIIRDLLERGRFTADDSQVVGQLIICFVGMFVGASSGELLARGFYTLGDTRTPTLIGAISLTIGLIAKWSTLSLLGVWGIALSTSLTLMLSAGCMSCLLAMKTNRFVFAGIGWTLMQATIAALAACGLCLLPYTFHLGNTWTAAPLGAVAYWLMLCLLRNDDAILGFKWLSRHEFRRSTTTTDR